MRFFICGIKQINVGIEQLNKLSQGNAASSKELASTAEMLKNNISELKDITSFFTVKALPKK